MELNQGFTPQFKGQVLKQVYRVWLIRRWLPVLILEILLLSALLYWFGRIVFVQRLLENWFKIFFFHPFQTIPFVISSFAKTELVTKIVSIALVVLLALLLRSITQGILRLILVKKNYFGKVENGQN